jgi:ASC-1-like (ASCH) protein
MSNFVEYTLQPKYINLIRSGQKTCEGRINSGGFANLSIGQTIEFFSKKDPSNRVSCRVVGINPYNSFYDMLVGEGVENMLPGVSSVEEGVRIYENIPSYMDRARRSGVVSLRLELI